MIRSAARFLPALAALACCASDGPAPIDARTTCGAVPDPGRCEFTVATLEACPDVVTGCRGACNAVADCCYCEGTDWLVLEIDCPRCSDGGIDAP